jgi:hypothetical protein
MRWTEIEEYAAKHGVPLPSYRQLDRWTRQGRLTAEFRGDRHGRYRWWPPSEADAAFLVARLMKGGMDEDLAFALARAEPDGDGRRALTLDGAAPHVRIEVAAPAPVPAA